MDETTKNRAAILVASLVAANMAALGLLVSLGQQYRSIISPGLLAYGFGLRHAVDADHIAAIDNVTRKLVQDGQQPLTTGFFFSIGHSSVVVLLCIATLCFNSYTQSHLRLAEKYGGVIGTAVSATVLGIIGILNLYIAFGTYKEWCRAAARDPNDLVVQGDDDVGSPGFLVRLCPQLFDLIDAPHKMLLVGFLFGLGFDTASEVALLALAAEAPQSGVPPAVVMLLPLLFAAGMSLVDTLDSVLMLFAYGWSSVQPQRKLFYNFSITLTSAVIALGVGGLEVMGAAFPQWPSMQWMNAHFEWLGFLIIAFFAVSFATSVLYDQVEAPSWS
jgi:high-affinity nickel-transport protein